MSVDLPVCENVKSTVLKQTIQYIIGVVAVQMIDRGHCV